MAMLKCVISVTKIKHRQTLGALRYPKPSILET